MSQRLPHLASPKYCQEALAQLAMAVNSQRNYLHFSTDGAVSCLIEAECASDCVLLVAPALHLRTARSKIHRPN